MRHKIISSILLLLSVFLFSCNRKGEEWLVEHREEIETAAIQKDFFIPDSTTLKEKKQVISAYRIDLKGMTMESIESPENQKLWLDLHTKLSNGLDFIDAFNSKAGSYQLVHYLKNQYQGDTSNKTIFYKKINEILIQSDSFYLTAKTNLQSIDEKEGQAAVQQHFEDFHWLGDTLVTNVKESAISETLKSELLMNIQMTQLSIKDYIGFVNSFIYNNSDLEEVIDDTPNEKIEQ